MSFDAVSLVRDQPFFSLSLLALGALTLARFAFKTAVVLGQTFVWPGTSLKKFGAGKGAWAVVTGASDGIGRDFALQLGKAGYNVLLVARNPQKLAEVAEDVAKLSGLETRILTLDFASPSDTAFAALTDAASSLDVGVLVNNVGRSHNMPVDFVDTPQSEIDAILSININSTLRVTSAVLPGMISRKRGLILNVGSFSGAIASPMLATYSGSKAFLSTWSDALAAEVAPKGVVVQHLNTYFVVSNMSKIRRASLTTPTPRAYVRAVLARIGLSGGAFATGRPATLSAYPTHAIIDWALGVIGLKSVVIGVTHSMHKDIRKRALRKAERDAKKL